MPKSAVASVVTDAEIGALVRGHLAKVRGRSDAELLALVAAARAATGPADSIARVIGLMEGSYAAVVLRNERGVGLQLDDAAEGPRPAEEVLAEQYSRALRELAAAHRAEGPEPKRARSLAAGKARRSDRR